MLGAIKNKKIKIAVLVAVTILCIVAFRIYANMVANEERAKRVFQGAQIAVETAVVKRQDIVPTLLFSANLDPIWSADISPKIDSRLDVLNVDEGDYVKAGDVIAQMDVLELAAQAYQFEGALYEARSDSENARIDLERNERLYTQNAISKRDLDNARSKNDMARGRLVSAQGALNVLREKLDASTIRAPKTGVVTKRYLHAGYYVKSGSPIVSIADTTTLLAKADISEGQIGNIYMDAQADVTVEAYPGQSFKGAVSRISPMADLPARTFKTEITIPNTDGQLRAGMFATVAIRGKVRNNAIVIPQTAIVMREDQKTVYIVNSENVVQQVLLETGAVEEGNIEIIKGLSEGDVIVTGGQNKLRQGAKILPSQTSEAGK